MFEAEWKGDDSFDVQTIDVGDIIPSTTKVRAISENILQSDFRTKVLFPILYTHQMHQIEA